MLHFSKVVYYVSCLRWCIYYIYGVSSGYIQQYSRLNLGFFRPRPENSLGRAVPSGLRPSGTACRPREFFGLERKKTSVSGLYCRIYPSETPYIHYIYNKSLPGPFSCGFKMLVKLGTRRSKTKITILWWIFFIMLKVDLKISPLGT